MHLRMTGNLLLCRSRQDEPGRPHLRVRFELGRNARGPRSGCCSWTCAASARATCCSASDALAEYFASRLGVEPLSPDFTAEALRAQARGRKQPVKAFLLNQERVAGVGNIYADEALFRARIHPLRPVGGLRRPQIEALRDAVVETLELGIDAKGASIDDYRHVDGARGSFQDRFLVHTREGEPCPRCGTPIRKMRAAGRGTYICPNCQRRAAQAASARLALVERGEVRLQVVQRERSRDRDDAGRALQEPGELVRACCPARAGGSTGRTGSPRARSGRPHRRTCAPRGCTRSGRPQSGPRSARARSGPRRRPTRRRARSALRRGTRARTASDSSIGTPGSTRWR